MFRVRLNTEALKEREREEKKEPGRQKPCFIGKWQETMKQHLKRR